MNQRASCLAALLLQAFLLVRVCVLAQMPPTPRPTPAPTARPTPAPTTAGGKITGKSAPKHAAPAPTAAEIVAARTRLGELGYWVALDLEKPDASLRHALVAFQKVENRPVTGVLTAAELKALAAATRPTIRETGYHHIEVDLARQVLFVVDCCGAILRTLPISSGSGELFTEGDRTRRAVTPTGRFTVRRKIKGWRASPLGLLYYPNYFFDGYAIHGNPRVPPTPASHGCIRIPMFAAKEFYEMARLGLPVLIYDEQPLHQ